MNNETETLKQKMNNKYKTAKKRLTLTSETKIGDKVITENEFHFVIEVVEEMFEDLNNMVFKKNPDKLFKVKFDDYITGFENDEKTN